MTAVFPLVPKHPDQTSDLEKEPFLVGRIEQLRNKDTYPRKPKYTSLVATVTNQGYPQLSSLRPSLLDDFVVVVVVIVLAK